MGFNSAFKGLSEKKETKWNIISNMSLFSFVCYNGQSAITGFTEAITCFVNNYSQRMTNLRTMGHVQALLFFGRSGIVGYHRHHRRLSHHQHHHQAHVTMQFDKSVMSILKRRNSVPCEARLP
jgi:hypothetical protein